VTRPNSWRIRGTPKTTSAFNDLEARSTGLEPVTSGVTGSTACRPERPTAYNPLTSLRSSPAPGVRYSRPFTPFPEAFGPTLVQDAPPGRLHAVKPSPTPLLSVREAAARLRVSRSSVYALCAAGRLAHVRVSNALRLAGEDIESFLRRGRNSNG
jgi:excisionase family DNA binding protein